MSREYMCQYGNCSACFEGGVGYRRSTATVAWREERVRFCSPLHAAAWLLERARTKPPAIPDNTDEIESLLAELRTAMDSR
jgi:hypothetical protein